jgi:Predicted RNA-binding protein homologous to eukaryotic snRNP
MQVRQICTVEVCVLARELDKGLKGYKIDKFYETGQGRFRFRLSKERRKVDLVCVLCKRINTTDTVEAAEKPTNFVLAMRKRIGSFGIESISQVNNDRIISMAVSKGVEKAEIIIEMFGKGNIIVVDGSRTIKLAYTNHRFKDRVVFPKEKYDAPKNEWSKHIDVGR